MPGTALVTRNVQPILEKLQGVAGCPRLVHFDPARQELTLKEFGGVPLGQSDYLGTDNLERFLAIAEALARTLAAIQERGVIHKALNPTNILIRPDDLQVQIVGFDLATTIAEDPLPLDRLNCLPSDLAYVSPEQTGRMNRRVDHRTDLYSLGATLYALATGTPPFEDTDPLALIHAHLARTPKSPKIRAHWLPSRLSEVILILLAKEPNNRYQSAAGLVYDLQQVRHALSTPVRLERMQLQTHDLPLSPRQPHRLCGRERELATLMEAFTSVATGGAQGLFVAGYSGVGKTALVYELQRPVLLAHGRFFHGKFEQFQHDRSFLAPYQCLRQLCQVLLAEPEAAIAHWREQILAGLGPDAAALYEVLPDLELLLGPCPPAPKLGPIETQVRLLALLVALIRQIAMRGQPLVLFLDDLQWADQPSLDFMGALMEDSALDGLLLIGAYRDNEIDAAHPLRYLLQRPTASGTPPPVLTLASLTGGNLDALLADMLQTKPAEVQTLAAALFAKTHGNPLFTIVFLNNLYRQGALRPDPEHGRWQWDPAAILAYPASDNVVDFLAAGMKELADATKDTVVAAACLGIECTLGLLMLATALEPDELTEQLLPALERGIIITSDAIAFHRTHPDTLLWFCHDRMQQAVYQIRDDIWRGQLHLAMARRFAQAGDDPNLRLLAAEHYAASPSIIEATERPNVRKLLLAGAVKARQLGDFARAEHFLRQAIQLLYPDIRQSDYGEALILHTELHVALYSQSRYDAADSVYALLEDHTQEPVALVKSACVQINLAFFNALALTSWMVIVLFLVSSLTKPVENLGILLLPVAALTLLLEASFPSPNFMRQEVGWDIKIHVLLSMLAYSLLTLASVQSILLAIQDHHLHARQPAGFLRTLPPLQTMESLLFEMIGAGFALLTLALVSGFAFLEDMLAQHLVHKTVLSTLAWLVFGALLIGRFRYGWRGKTAIIWTLSGFVILILAYFGSKAVLELILQR